MLELTKHFGVKSAVCVSKLDLTVEMTEAIEMFAEEAGTLGLGRIGYDAAAIRRAFLRRV